MNEIKKPLAEPVFIDYDYYPAGAISPERVTIAVMPDYYWEAYDKHQMEDEMLALQYQEEFLGEFGYSDEDIFYYMLECEYAKVINDLPETGDKLIEVS